MLIGVLGSTQSILVDIGNKRLDIGKGGLLIVISDKMSEEVLESLDVVNAADVDQRSTTTVVGY